MLFFLGNSNFYVLSKILPSLLTNNFYHLHLWEMLDCISICWKFCWHRVSRQWENESSRNWSGGISHLRHCDSVRLTHWWSLFKLRLIGVIDTAFLEVDLPWWHSLGNQGRFVHCVINNSMLDCLPAFF